MKRKWIIAGTLLMSLALLAAVSVAREDHKEKMELSEAAKAAIAGLSSSAAVQEIEREELSLEAYDVEVKDAGGEYNVVVTENGKLVSKEMEIEKDAIPAAVAAVFAEKTKGAALEEIEKEEIYAEVQLVPLAAPKTLYGARATVDDKDVEITVDAAGNVVEMKTLDKEDEDDNGAMKADDDDDKEQQDADKDNGENEDEDDDSDTK